MESEDCAVVEDCIVVGGCIEVELEVAGGIVVAAVVADTADPWWLKKVTNCGEPKLFVGNCATPNDGTIARTSLGAYR